MTVQATAGAGHTQKWIPIEDVRFHREVSRYVISKKERASA